MAQIKYQNVEDSAGERIATNALYTGHKIGKPLQDAAEGADNAPYVTERSIVHCGTILQDAADLAFPEVAPTYTKVTPDGTENPASEGWYEYNTATGEYELTEDTTVTADKDYFEVESDDDSGETGGDTEGDATEGT